MELSLSIHHKSCGRTECEFRVEDPVLSFRKLGCPENSFYNLLTWVLLLFHFANEEIEVLRGQLVQVTKLLSGRARWSSSQKCPHFNSNSHTAAHRTAGAALTQSLQLRKGANRFCMKAKMEV